jgi:hypothetical protein
MATLTECIEVPKQAVVSEATRERETFRYESTFLSTVSHSLHTYIRIDNH